MSSASTVAPAAADFISFVNESISPYHAVAEVQRRLEASGFVRLSEREADWDIKPNNKYYVTRNSSAVIAFAVGGKYVPGNGFAIAAAHTDSPCLRVKPVSSLCKSGYMSVGVETYGGGLWYTWLDRDLSVAGKVMVAKGDGSFEAKLVRINKPILRIPSLAIHLQRDVNSEGVKLNAESHLPPMLATIAKAKLNETESAKETTEPLASATARHHPALVLVIAKELGVDPSAIHDFDLVLYDTQPSAIGGLHDEFIFSGRLDNLMMTYTTITGLVNSTDAASLSDDSVVRIAASFDHEEVGSDSVPGAGGSFFEDVLLRLCPTATTRAAAIRKSILVSADMAHALHPNFPEKHAELLRPEIHKGIVIKCNANQRYATTPVTSLLFRQIAAEAGVPVQWFTNRQDAGCGSTIGPIVATRLGLRTVDVGLPQLSMHSIREVCGTDDTEHGVKFFTHFYGRFAAVEAAVSHSD